MSEDKPEHKTHSIGQHTVPCKLTFARRDKVAHVIKSIRESRSDWPNSENVFVVNSNGKLVGVVDFQKLLSATPQSRLEEIMDRKFDSVTDHSHQHHVARLAIQKGCQTVPVTNQEGVFLGIIDEGQILKILHEEHVEDLMRFSGIIANEADLDVNKLSITKMLAKRIPWLILGLIGGMIATKIVGNFEGTLQKELALAFFIPVIVYMNDAVGTQTQTIYVRTAAFEKVKIKKYLVKEAKTSLMLAFILSFLVAIFSFVIFPPQIFLKLKHLHILLSFFL